MPGESGGLLRRFLRLFFWHFYHGFAWTYDFVATVVSIGRWNDWIRCTLPYLKGSRILEIGHGPGHLQVDLRQRLPGLSIGLDESPQMGRIARQRLLKAACTDPNLVRGVGQQLPFAAATFDTVVATFPTEYIFDAETLQDIRRVIGPGGRFIVVPAAWIGRRNALDRLAAWLFRVTGQTPIVPARLIGERLRKPFEEADFAVTIDTVDIRSSQVLIVVGETGTPTRNPEIK
ncbi:MAG TPA: class I SAM-dependent methyltransferase [Anaerolineales bacterium]